MIMSEFNNRIIAQREVLKVVNGMNLYDEPLLSLAEKVITRWVIINGIDANETIVLLLKVMSGDLLFLANKSQEQITEDYSVLSKKVTDQLITLKQEIAKHAARNL